MSWRLGWLALYLLLGATLLRSSLAFASDAELSRFFFSGSGKLGIENAHTGERAEIHYRRSDGTYDDEALTELRHLFRSRADQREGAVSLRLVELLAYVQGEFHPKKMLLVSGYRSPEFNASLSGAAESSLHTQGLAADVMLTGIDLKRAWVRLREARTGGVGYYKTGKYLHIDVGQPRFWEETTTRVSEKLATGNARVFVRTDFDRNPTLEGTQVRIYNVTAVPLRIAKRASLAGYADAVVHLQSSSDDGECIVVAAPGAFEAMKIDKVEREPQTGTRRTRIVLSTCPPRLEQTPSTLESNEVEIGR